MTRQEYEAHLIMLWEVRSRKLGALRGEIGRINESYAFQVRDLKQKFETQKEEKINE